MDAEKQNGVCAGLSDDEKKSWDDDYATIKKKLGGGFRPKPAEILAKMIDGKVNKWLGEITLLGQPFVKNPDETVEKLLAAKKAKVARFVRFGRSEEHTSELQSLMRISYAVFCLKKKKRY